jgi:hypothetical protein
MFVSLLNYAPNDVGVWDMEVLFPTFLTWTLHESTWLIPTQIGLSLLKSPIRIFSENVAWALNLVSTL